MVCWGLFEKGGCGVVGGWLVKGVEKGLKDFMVVEGVEEVWWGLRLKDCKLMFV